MASVTTHFSANAFEICSYFLYSIHANFLLSPIQGHPMTSTDAPVNCEFSLLPTLGMYTTNTPQPSEQLLSPMKGMALEDNYGQLMTSHDAPQPLHTWIKHHYDIH